MKENGQGAVALLLQIGPGLESKSGLLRDALAAAWPGHPRIFLSLPPGAAAPQHLDTFICGHAGWVSMLQESLTRIKASQPAIRHILALIDDHCPLRPCDGERLWSTIRAAVAEDMKCACFVTYAWPWSITAPDSIDAEGRRMTWKAIDILEVAGLRFARVPEDFFRYNQCQPALWDLEYCLSLCDRALELGIDDPWSFEAMRLSGQPQHYVADYPWPTVHHGFRAAGRVNPEAIFFARGEGPHLAALKQELLAEFTAERGPLGLTMERSVRLLRRFRSSAGRIRRWSG